MSEREAKYHVILNFSHELDIQFVKCRPVPELSSIIERLGVIKNAYENGS